VVFSDKKLNWRQNIVVFINCLCWIHRKNGEMELAGTHAEKSDDTFVKQALLGTSLNNRRRGRRKSTIDRGVSVFQISQRKLQVCPSSPFLLNFSFPVYPLPSPFPYFPFSSFPSLALLCPPAFTLFSRLFSHHPLRQPLPNKVRRALWAPAKDPDGTFWVKNHCLVIALLTLICTRLSGVDTCLHETAPK